jgi:hypothetical protein
MPQNGKPAAGDSARRMSEDLSAREASEVASKPTENQAREFAANSREIALRTLDYFNLINFQKCEEGSP